ncbi:hypothetical protein GGR52DRAFT_492495 [Hypoxylon sp. FL1284]|nr:hypothetical protein GGR52DRAFT_492495 [Hypoxylon sp. FL1284]
MNETYVYDTKHEEFTVNIHTSFNDYKSVCRGDGTHGDWYTCDNKQDGFSARVRTTFYDGLEIVHTFPCEDGGQEKTMTTIGEGHLHLSSRSGGDGIGLMWSQKEDVAYLDPPKPSGTCAERSEKNQQWQLHDIRYDSTLMGQLFGGTYIDAVVKFDLLNYANESVLYCWSEKGVTPFVDIEDEIIPPDQVFDSCYVKYDDQAPWTAYKPERSWYSWDLLGRNLTVGQDWKCIDDDGSETAFSTFGSVTVPLECAHKEPDPERYISDIYSCGPMDAVIDMKTA